MEWYEYGGDAHYRDLVGAKGKDGKLKH